MNIQALVEELLQSGKALGSRGMDEIEKRAGIPEQGAERDAMLSGLGKGAAAAGLLALLVGTNTGRKVTGTALKVGGLAAVGGIAYQAYKTWQANQAASTDSSANTPVNELHGPEKEQRSLALLKAMIAAAKADGHIDETERASIETQVNNFQLNDQARQLVQQEIEKPLNIQEIAALADSPEVGAEIYLASLVIIDGVNEQEQIYLQNLARALNLPPELVAQLKHQVNQAG